MHARSTVSRLFLGLSGVVLAVGLLPGCKGQPRRQASPAVMVDGAPMRHVSAHGGGPREGAFVDGLPGGSAGDSSAVVFSNPDVQRYYIAVRPEVLGMLETRNDDRMAIYDPAPRTALDSWPTDPRPSLDSRRYGRLQTGSPDTFIYYGVEREWRDGRWYWGGGRSWER
jgi:hypothetical protein